MRSIKKGTEPTSLVQHRCSAHADYDNYDDKGVLRQHLVAEQRGLCCYCMSRIAADESHMKIEHWHCQKRYPQEQLHYHNLLGACLGGNGKPRKRQTCDTRKGDFELKWNPADPTHEIEKHIRYQSDGTIKSDDSDFDAELNDVLNLNIKFLKENRQGIMDAVIGWWKREKDRIKGPVPRERLEAKRNFLVGGSGVLQPYSRVAAWWIEQKLARLAP
jgi:uncharacterized protein (TIGR02646 family)